MAAPVARFVFALTISIVTTGLVTSRAHASSPGEMGNRPLRVYVYDSFPVKHLTPLPAPVAEAVGPIEWVRAGGSSEVVSRLELEGFGSNSADIVIGVDASVWLRIRANVDAETVRDVRRSTRWAGPCAQTPDGFVPLDWGIHALMVDRKALPQVPDVISWRALAEGAYGLRGSWAALDPRSSAPGLAFLLASAQVFSSPQAFAEFHRAVGKTWLALSTSWTQGYGLFTSGKAKAAWSFWTSEGYHMSEGDLSKRALAMVEGNPSTCEGAIRVKRSSRSRRDRDRAVAFLRHLTSAPIQTVIAEKQWMYPARSGVAPPEAIAKLGVPKRTLPLSFEVDPRETLKAWERAVY